MPGEVLDMMELDMADTIESEFGSPVTLIDPAGNIVTKSVNGGLLYGRFTNDFMEASPEGNTIITKEPLLILRISSLARVPAPGETWGLFVTGQNGKQSQYLIDGQTREPERADSIGFIRLFPRKAVQS